MGRFRIAKWPVREITRSKRHILYFIAVILGLQMFILVPYGVLNEKSRMIAHIECYNGTYLDLSGQKLYMFEELNETELFDQLTDSAIFFVESSCPGDGVFELTTRQACAIESAALQNERTTVFVLLASPRGYEIQPKEYEALFHLKNVKFRSINLWRYANGTPAAEWLKTEELFKSRFLAHHMSDFLRYLTMLKFGGTYLDMDVVVRKKLEDLPPNYTGAQSADALGVGVMNFGRDVVGHAVAEDCMR